MRKILDGYQGFHEVCMDFDLKQILISAVLIYQASSQTLEPPLIMSIISRHNFALRSSYGGIYS